MIEDVYNHLLSLDEFRDLSPENISVEPLQTLAHSEVYRVQTDSPPTRLILKKSGPSDIAGLAERERRFYRDIAPRLPSWLVPNCLLVVEGKQTGMLIIEDLSESHHLASGFEPTRLQCRCLVEALATLHGLTGNHSTIQETWKRISTDLPAGTIEQRLSFFQRALEPFIAMLGDRVDRTVENFLVELKGLDQGIKRLAPHANVLVHGDAHFANALFSPLSRACLIDWGMPMIGFGEIDLAHALALNLPPHLRREWEEEMLGVYLDKIAACGSPIERKAFDARYRLGVLYSFVSPIVWWGSGVAEPQWWSALTNSLNAARDLGLLR